MGSYLPQYVVMYPLGMYETLHLYFRHARLYLCLFFKSTSILNTLALDCPQLVPSLSLLQRSEALCCVLSQLPLQPRPPAPANTVPSATYRCPALPSWILCCPLNIPLHRLGFSRPPHPCLPDCGPSNLWTIESTRSQERNFWGQRGIGQSDILSLEQTWENL